MIRFNIFHNYFTLVFEIKGVIFMNFMFHWELSCQVTSAGFLIFGPHLYLGGLILVLYSQMRWACRKI